jgi:hypothetical protein
MPLPHPTSYPHPTIDPISIPLISSFHLNKYPELITIRINFIRQIRIRKLSQDPRGTCSPAMSLDDDVCRRIIPSLKEVIGLKTSGTVWYDYLTVLTAGLNYV